MAAIEYTLLRGKKIAIFGLGITSQGTIRAARSGPAQLVVSDENSAVVDKLLQQGLIASVEVQDLLSAATWKQHRFNGIFISPGIHPDHKIYRLAKQYQVAVFSELDILAQHTPAKIIGITGTNGKSTTAVLLAHVLQTAGIPHALGGNIGAAILGLPAVNASGFYVLELSSYQLLQSRATVLDYAVLLNISPDHLDYHGSFSAYIKAKAKIISGLTSTGKLIIGADDQACLTLAEQFAENNKISIPVSTHNLLVGGVCWSDGKLIDARSGNLDIVATAEQVEHLPGEHNRQNIAAVFAVARSLGINSEDILAAISSFQGLPHRMQKVASHGRISFYNDSKATNVRATCMSVAALAPCILIAGGRAKQGDDWQLLLDKVDCIKAMLLIGEAQAMIHQIFADLIPCRVCKSLFQAISEAFSLAQQTEEQVNICLAPGCASFDMFANYVERGHAFMAGVELLLNPDMRSD